MRAHLLLPALALVTVAAACGRSTEPSAGAAGGADARCVVALHGKGGSGGSTVMRAGDVRELRPNGNAPGWNGRQWLYYPAESYVQARDAVAKAIEAEGCARVIVSGFSNGAAFAAKLACSGERFGGTVIGFLIDDPVVDHGVDGCASTADVKMRLYWTGDIDIAPGWDCVAADWTCEGGTSIGIDAYERQLGTTRVKSNQTTHRPYDDPPELTEWWD